MDLLSHGERNSGSMVDPVVKDTPVANIVVLRCDNVSSGVSSRGTRYWITTAGSVQFREPTSNEFVDP